MKVRGGEVIGEFATLVDPGGIPPEIVQLTGYHDRDGLHCPDDRLGAPVFLEFAPGSVLVAHNSGSDIGFMSRPPHAPGIPWPSPPCCARSASAAGC